MSPTVRLCLIAIAILTAPAIWYYNWRECKELFGAAICSVGALLNFLAVAFNGWQMPVFTDGYIPPHLIWKVADNPRLPWLIDRFHWGMSTYSAGDVLIYGGAVLFAVGLVYRIGKRVREWARGPEPQHVSDAKIDELFKEWNQ